MGRNPEWGIAKEKRLQMKSAANVSQQLIRTRTESKLKVGLLKTAIQSGFVD
jgi:hypothetical protein